MCMQIKVSGKASYSHEWGGSAANKHSDSISVTVKVLPKSKKLITLTSYRQYVDVPYVATLIIIYADDSRSTMNNFHGTYRKVQLSDTKVKYGDDVTL